MIMKKMTPLLAGLLTAIAFSSSAQAVDFWHSNTVWAGQGMCAASFTFDSGLESVEQLQVRINVVDKANTVVNDSILEIDSFGSSNAERYATTFLESEEACDSDLKIVVTHAEAIINNQKQDLLATKQLSVHDFVPFRIEISPQPKQVTQQINNCNNPRFTTVATIFDKDGYTNVRSQPNAKSTIIEKVFDDEPFSTFQQKGNWWQVCTPTGQIGYMYHDRIRM